ncbi:MAG: hypothetical protein V7K40_24740 [Nostoc sp.]
MLGQVWYFNLTYFYRHDEISQNSDVYSETQWLHPSLWVQMTLKVM